MALPRYGALRLGYKIVHHSAILMRNKFSVPMVYSMVGIRAMDPSAEEVVRDLLCVMAMKLQVRGGGRRWCVTCCASWP